MPDNNNIGNSNNYQATQITHTNVTETNLNDPIHTLPGIEHKNPKDINKYGNMVFDKLNNPTLPIIPNIIDNNDFISAFDSLAQAQANEQFKFYRQFALDISNEGDFTISGSEIQWIVTEDLGTLQNYALKDDLNGPYGQRMAFTTFRFSYWEGASAGYVSDYGQYYTPFADPVQTLIMLLKKQKIDSDNEYIKLNLFKFADKFCPNGLSFQELIDYSDEYYAAVAAAGVTPDILANYRKTHLNLADIELKTQSMSVRQILDANAYYATAGEYDKYLDIETYGKTKLRPVEYFMDNRYAIVYNKSDFRAIQSDPLFSAYTIYGGVVVGGKSTYEASGEFNDGQVGLQYIVANGVMIGNPDNWILDKRTFLETGPNNTKMGNTGPNVIAGGGGTGIAGEDTDQSLIDIINASDYPDKHIISVLMIAGKNPIMVYLPEGPIGGPGSPINTEILMQGDDPALRAISPAQRVVAYMVLRRARGAIGGLDPDKLFVYMFVNPSKAQGTTIASLKKQNYGI